MKFLSRLRFWGPIAIALGICAGVAAAQNTVTANQGRPGQQGAWPVSISGGSSSVAVTPELCTTNSHKVVSITNVAGDCPSTQLANRRFVVICNSGENIATRNLKVRVDGVAPVLGIATPGDFLNQGDCIVYAITSSVVPQCISNAAGGTAVTTYECL